MKMGQCTIEICYNCNIFHESCNGVRLYKRDKAQKTDNCKNRVTTSNNTKSPLQVLAFISLYKTKRRCGMLTEQAFVESIVQTSDDVFEEAKAKRPDLISDFERY